MFSTEISWHGWTSGYNGHNNQQSELYLRVGRKPLADMIASIMLAAGSYLISRWLPERRGAAGMVCCFVRKVGLSYNVVFLR